MLELLHIAATIGTPFAFLAFISGLLYASYSRRLKYEEVKLQSLPENERAVRTDEYLTRYGIDGKHLPQTDKLMLIRDEMAKRHRRSLIVVIVTACVLVVCFGLAVIAYVARTPQTQPVTAIPVAKDSILPAVALQHELSKFREALSQPPRQDRKSPTTYPDAYDNELLAKWAEPRKSSISQIARFAEIDPTAVVRALIPLLADSDGVVVAGALCAIRDILNQQPREADNLKQLLPNGFAQPLNLISVYIGKQDFSVFAGTNIFYNARLNGSVLDGAILNGVQMREAVFAHATVLNCSFKNTNLEISNWDGSRVRNTLFENANMNGAYASTGDFGRASSDPTTYYVPNRFYNTSLGSAVLNRTSMMGARLHGAILGSAQVSGADFRGATLSEGQPATRDLLEAAHVMLLDEDTKFGKEP